ncbi:MAG: single-stranded DNA-binding protein [Thermotogota bacterium]
MTPSIKVFQDGSRIAQFTMATTEPGFRSRDGREIPEKTDWHNIVVRGGLVKVVENYVHSGQQLYIEGKIRTRSYEKDGVNKYVTEIICETLKMLGRKSY